MNNRGKTNMIVVCHTTEAERHMNHRSIEHLTEGANFTQYVLYSTETQHLLDNIHHQVITTVNK